LDIRRRLHILHKSSERLKSTRCARRSG
jgi:hypothetical protein